MINFEPSCKFGGTVSIHKSVLSKVICFFSLSDFLTFKRIEEVAHKSLPTIRDYDNHIYVRKFKDSFLMGVFEPQARPWNFNSGETTTHVPGIAIAHSL